MKNLLLILGFIGFFQIASAQDATTESTDPVIKITLSESDGERAKLLKDLKYGELFKGESKTVFLVRTTEKKMDELKSELSEVFPGCKLQIVAKEN